MCIKTSDIGVKIIIKLFIIFIFLTFTINLASSNYTIEPRIKIIFSNFVKKIERKMNSKKEIIFLEKINTKINYILEKNKISTEKKKLLNDILLLSNEKIFDLEVKQSFKNISQDLIEATVINNLKNKLKKINIPSYLKNTGNKIIKVSSNQEFIENNEIKKVSLKKYFVINSSVYSQFKNKKGIFLLKENGDIWFVDNYYINNKIRYSDASKIFKGFITKDNRFFKEGNIFYSYNFKNFKFFDDKYGFYFDTLKNNNIDINNSILFFTDNKYNFITKYSKVKLINSNIIYGVVDKKNFLEDLVNDKLYITSDTDKLFLDLKNKISKITSNKKREEKIKNIYNFILDNVKYTKNLNIEDKKIFSGILTYKNNDGVCEGYVKLTSYALKFAGIKDVRVIRGDVIDAVDFPNIGHAWLSIGDKYYDPTFDDPLGSINTRKFNQYRYFGLPKDLLYANRFDYGNTPEYLKSKSLNYRKNFIKQNLFKLSDKYKGKKYLLLDSVNFYKENNIKIGSSITINEAKKIIPFFEVTEKSNGEIIFYKNGIKKNITKLQFYNITDKDLGQVLSQLNYKLEGLYLFKWNKKGKIEYRLGFNVVIK